MPLPWKKTNKVSSISRLVAGLHHSPKRGGSLVVETGFPTSLVDLFVKNKDRLKKPSKKKSPQHSPVQTTNVPPPPPPSPSPPQPAAAVCCDGLAVKSASGVVATRAEVEEVVVGKECDGVCGDVGAVENGLFVGVLKILMAVVVALSTKKLAVGITMSAFLLLMLEYAGSRVLVFLKPCSKARNVIDSFVLKVKVLSISSKFKEKDVSSVNEIQRCEEGSSKGLACLDACDSCGLVDEIELKSSDGEIQVVDSNWEMETSERNLVEENEHKCDALVCQKELSRRSKIRRKFVKNFVPKKLRNAKKEWKNKGKEVESKCDCEIDLCGSRDDKLVKEKCHKQEQDKDKEHEKSRFLLGGGCQGQVVYDDGDTPSLRIQLQDETRVAQVEETVEVERKGNSGYLILFLIVLAGLVGGRVFALLITLAWCLILKLVGKLRFVPVSC